MLDVIGRRETYRTELRLVKSKPERAHRVNLETFHQARLVADQPLHIGAQRMSQRLRECCEQDASVRTSPRQVNGAMKRDDRFAVPAEPATRAGPE